MEKIAVLSLSTKTPKMMTAALKDSVLIISEVKDLPATGLAQKEMLPDVIKKLREKGFKVLVDEPLPIISGATGASQVTLKTRHLDGRPAVVVGMERYLDLTVRSLISLPETGRGAYNIPPSIVDTEYNGKGEEVYRINWPDIRVEHVLVLLCCFATVYHNVASADYISRMDDVFNKEMEERVAQTPFNHIINYELNKSGTALPETLAGKSLDDGTTVL